jgi:hypothetical protein
VRSIGPISFSIIGLLLAVLQSHPVCAQIRVQGSTENIRLEAHDATVEEILAVLRARFDLRYRDAALNRRVTATYEGSLRKILARVLDGYDYVIGPKGGQNRSDRRQHRIAAPSETRASAPARRASPPRLGGLSFTDQANKISGEEFCVFAGEIVSNRTYQ